MFFPRRAGVLGKKRCVEPYPTLIIVRQQWLYPEAPLRYGCVIVKRQRIISNLLLGFRLCLAVPLLLPSDDLGGVRPLVHNQSRH